MYGQDLLDQVIEMIRAVVQLGNKRLTKVLAAMRPRRVQRRWRSHEVSAEEGEDEDVSLCSC